MAKVTSKLQVTVPRAIADQFGIRPGDSIDWVAAGDAIRVTPAGRASAARDLTRERRVRLFDQATKRQQHRQRDGSDAPRPKDRGWTLEELYRRGDAR